MQQMDEAWKSTFNRSGKCHHCSRTAGPNTNTTSPPYPSTDTCPLHNLLIEMLDRSGLGKIAYLFDRIHTLSELSNLLGSDLDPRTGIQNPNLPISLDQQTRLWLLVNSLHSSFPQYRVWTTIDVAKRLHRLYGPHSTTSTDELSLGALQNNIDGQALTTLLYTFDKLDHNNSKLCHPAESGGLGLSIQAVNQIQKDVQGFTRINGFVHYSAFAPRSRRLEAHHTVQIKILKGQGLGAPGILAPNIGIVYQRIATEETIQSLRQVLSARTDVSPMHSEEGPLTFRQDNGTVVFLQNDKTL